MNQYDHKVFLCSSCEHYQQAEDKTESMPVPPPPLLIKCFINVASVLICCRLRIAALMPSLIVCVCAWTASACRSTRACSSTRSVCVTSVSQSETFPQFSSHVIIQCCCRTGEYDVTVCVCVCACSATPVGIVVVRGDCDLETCRLYIDRLQEVSASHDALVRLISLSTESIRLLTQLLALTTEFCLSSCSV